MMALSTNTQSLIAGALFEFVGHLSSQAKNASLSAHERKFQVSEELKSWAFKKGLDLTKVDPDSWNKQAGEITLEMLANDGNDDSRRVVAALKAFSRDFPLSDIDRPEVVLRKWATRHQLDLSNPDHRWSLLK